MMHQLCLDTGCRAPESRSVRCLPACCARHAACWVCCAACCSQHAPAVNRLSSQLLPACFCPTVTNYCWQQPLFTCRCNLERCLPFLLQASAGVAGWGCDLLGGDAPGMRHQTQLPAEPALCCPSALNSPKTPQVIAVGGCCCVDFNMLSFAAPGYGRSFVR